jgi:hypothetical protein
VVLFLFIGCGGGGGGSDNPDDNGDRETVKMSGEWNGTVDMNLNGREDQKFTLVQKENDLSGHFDGPGGQSDDVNGSIDKFRISLSVKFGQGDGTMEFHYEGSLENNVYSGDFSLIVNDEIQDEGIFSFQKEEDAPSPRPKTVDMSGSWEGTMSTQRFGDSPLLLELDQDGSNIAGDMTFDGLHTSNVNGSVDNSTVSISAIYPTDIDKMLEFVFKGTANADQFSGNITVYLGGEIDERGGTFTVSKDGSIKPDTELSRYEVEAGSCFELATGEETPSPCGNSADIFFFGVDPYSEKDIFCKLEGTFSDLESVPVDYAGCDWGNYIEGGFGLENTGVIVRDLSYQHHYRMRIIENESPTITFEYKTID